MDTGSGWKWIDELGNERLRFMRPKKGKKAFWSREKQGYFRWNNSDGDFLDIDGNVVTRQNRNIDEFQELTHIMYEGL